MKKTILVLAVLVFLMVGFRPTTVRSAASDPLIVNPPGVICSSDANGLVSPVPPETHGSCDVGVHSDFGGSGYVLMAAGAKCSPPPLPISAAAIVQAINCNGAFSITGDGGYAFAEGGDGVSSTVIGYPFYFGAHPVKNWQITSCYGNSSFSPPDSSPC